METKYQNEDPINETQSLEVIQEMIKISCRKLKSDGILLIIWGWIMFLHYLILFILRKVTLTFRMSDLLNYLAMALVLAGLIYTIYYVYQQRRQVKTYIGISLRYLWISTFMGMVLVNLIQFNVLHSINFELQHPIFMVLVAFAIASTGIILRNTLLIFGGAVFGLLAYLASHFTLPDQLLVESIAWCISLAIPGHILFSKRN